LKPSFTAYSNPTNFLYIAAKVLPWRWGLTALAFALGLFGTFTAPPDFQQGEMVRIMYIHVPAAWVAMRAYTLMAITALGSLVWRHPPANAAQKAAGPLGAAFTFICLDVGHVLGVGRPAASRAVRAASIMTLVGFINIPIVKFPVDWWNTLHEPASVFRIEGSTIAGPMLWPLLVMSLAMRRTCLSSVHPSIPSMRATTRRAR
jgi:heme exporter protein C